MAQWLILHIFLQRLILKPKAPQTEIETKTCQIENQTNYYTKDKIYLTKPIITHRIKLIYNHLHDILSYVTWRSMQQFVRNFLALASFEGNAPRQDCGQELWAWSRLRFWVALLLYPQLDLAVKVETACYQHLLY